MKLNLTVLVFLSLILNTIETSYSQESDNRVFVESEEDSVYIAFYCEYFPRMTHLHVSQESSVIEWLENNWSDISSVFPKDKSGPYCEENKLCAHYGLCVAQQKNNNAIFPTSISSFLLSNNYKLNGIDTILSNENVIEIKTDDDEIFINWMVFDKKYKQENFNKVALWFYDELPTKFGSKGTELKVKQKVEIKGNSEGKTYIIPYLYEHKLDFKSVIEIDGMRIPELTDFIRTGNESIKSNYELFKIYKLLESDSSLGLIDALEKNVSTDEENYLLFQNSNSTSSKHFIDIIGEFWFPNYKYTREEFRNSAYKRWLIFDDLWVEENIDLAKSIVNMRTSQSIINSANE